MNTGPELAAGDGALGFWKALEEVFPTTRHQRCWVPKIANILNKLPKSVQKNAKGDLAEHGQHLRTTNPIESVFATVRHRTVRTKGCLSHGTALVMVFKLVMAAAKTWRRLKGRNQLPKIIEGVKFADGIEVKELARHAA